MKRILLLGITLFGAACSSASGPVARPADPVEAQAAEGAALYAENCAQCHGDAGEGSKKAPKVVGEGALPLHAPAGAKRDIPFRTALDVFQWARVTMPGDEPGTLSDAQMVSILAFDLKANGVKLDRPLDGALAAELVLNP